MIRVERGYAKQVLLSIKDWDAFQQVIRQWGRLFAERWQTTL